MERISGGRRRVRPVAVTSVVLAISLVCLVVAVATGYVRLPTGQGSGVLTTARVGAGPDAQGVERSTRLQRRGAQPSTGSRETRGNGGTRDGAASDLQPVDESDRQLAAEVESLPTESPAPTGLPILSASPLPTASPQPTASSLLTGLPAPEVDPVPDGEPTPVVEAAQFRVATFNVLGASHTAPGGNKTGWAPASQRMVWAVQLLRGLRPDLVGFQELETPQHRDFARLTHGRFGVFPGAARHLGSTRNSIAWDRSTWQLVSARTIPVPYFHGKRVGMPYLRLQHRASGREVYVINIHNPATTRRWGDNERWRDLANALEIRLANRLRATGVPVLLMGDFNEREEAFCRTTAQADMRAANGGSAGPGRCVPPTSTGIDWIFGSPGIRFSDYTRHQTAFVRRTTDHPIVVTRAELSARPAG